MSNFVHIDKNSETVKISDAAKIIGVSTKTLRRWEARGILNSVRTSAGHRIYNLDDLQKIVGNPLPKLTSFRNFLGLAITVILLSVGITVSLRGAVGDVAILKTGLLHFVRNDTTEPSPEVGLDSFSQGQTLKEESVKRSDLNRSVLATTTEGITQEISDFVFSVAVPALFKNDVNFLDSVKFKKGITAPNVVYSVNGETGEVVLELTAGSGITVSGTTVTNADTGSSQKIFKTIKVGSSSFSAGSNTDTLELVASGGITLSSDTTNKKVTINSAAPDYTLSGFTDGGTSVYLSTITDSVGIGTASPSYKLDVAGTGHFTSTLTLDGNLTTSGNVTLGNASTDTITFTGRIANGTGVLPATDLGADLGSSSFRFNNLWVANINSNSSQSFAGQTTFSYPPTDTTISQASVLINPATSATGGQLLGFSIAGYQRALIDAEGDLILGYNNLTSAPTTSYPLTIYGHSGTNVAYVDTSGNLNITGGFLISGTSVLSSTTLGANIVNSSLTGTGALASGSIATGFGAIDTGADNIITTGTVGSAGLTSFTGNSLAINSITSTGVLDIVPTLNLSGNALTSSGALSITPTAGSNLNISLSTTGDFKVNTNDLVVDTSAGSVGIGTTTPSAKLQVTSTTEQLRLGYDTSNYWSNTVGVSGGLTMQGVGAGGALTITPTAGNNLNIALSGTGDMVVNTNDLVVDTSSGYIGINTTAPTALLDLAGTSGIDAFRLTNSGTKVLGLSYATNSTIFDQTSTDPTNKLVNPTFDSDLTSWSEVPSYTLNDQFTTDRAAGAVNGTSSEPTGGTRTVVDTENKLSISGSQLSFAGGKTSPAWGDPLLKYPSTSRVAGKLITTTVNASDYAKYFQIGFETTATPTQSLDMDGVYFSPLGGIITTVSPYPVVASVVNSTTYQVATVLRSTGYYIYIKGGIYTNWTLLWIESTRNTATLYPSVISYDGAFTADNIRIPTSTWLPTPLAYDTFTRGDGAIGSSETTGPDSQTTPSLAWTGGAISTNKNVITPTEGSDMFDAGAGTFDSGVYSWTANGTNTVTNDTNSLKVTYVDSANGATEYLQDSKDLNADLTNNTWYLLQFDAKVSAGGSVNVYSSGSGTNNSGPAITNTTFQTYYMTIRKDLTSGNPYLMLQNMGAGESIWLDNISIKPITASTLFSSVSTSDSDVIADTGITLTATTSDLQGGIVTNLDSTSSPANFLIAYVDSAVVGSGKLHLDKVVGGVYTSLISTSFTYSAGATLRVITYTSSGSLKVRVYYNNALVGTEQTVSDAGIISNTKHGLFSTYSGNSFDNFTLWARGTGAEYTGAPFEELTATRNTTTKYNNSTASVQLVTSGTDANYLQSVNVGDTSTYNLIAYAYTDGSAVTSADLSLYYDTVALTTTYTPMGGTGWYKLTGSFTGVASAKDYGVRVKAGRTVYVDEMHLQVGTGTNQTMYVLNSNTGVTGLNVQGLINGTLNGVATFSKAGTISDADFTTATDGLMGIDTTNHRIYFREGGAWSYIARTAGFQIPKEEVEDQQLATGDLLLPYVESIMSDGALHGLYKKMSDVVLNGLVVSGDTTLGDAIITGDLMVNNINSTQELSLQSLALNSISFVGGNIKFTKEGLLVGNDLIRGKIEIPENQTEVNTTMNWLESPSAVTLTPEIDVTAWVTNISKDGFVIHTSNISEIKTNVYWQAIW